MAATLIALRSLRCLRVLAVAALALVGCARADHQQSYGWMLENHYGDGVPAQQQEALNDLEVTRAEMEFASFARDECLFAIEGIVWVEGFSWGEGKDFTGGAYRVAQGVEESTVEVPAEACYYHHLALVETAWLDQEYFGGWTEENLLSQSVVRMT